MSEKTTAQLRPGNALRFLWRSLLVGLAYTLATVIGGMVAQATGLPTPAMAAGASPTQALMTTFLAGVVIALALGPLATRLTVPTVERAALLFGMIFVLNSLLSVIEALFFTTLPVDEQVYGMVVAAVGHIGLAVSLALLFRPASEARNLLTMLRETLRQRRWASWAWRVAPAGVGGGWGGVAGCSDSTTWVITLAAMAVSVGAKSTWVAG
jgi:uncharacterized membrane protein